MPYNTRRISLSLPSLGVHLPGSGSSRSHNRTNSDIAPPPKRVKRSHTIGSLSSSKSTSTTPPPHLQFRTQSATALRPNGLGAESTPPPSPPSSHQAIKIETDGINDDIVVAVLQQLEKTGNRPHLIKELVAILINTLSVVESSANPAAIISSRLANYLKRPWSTLAPCPLAKEQTKAHPRAVYYFLTTCPRQEIPEFTGIARVTKRVMSPAISTDPSEEEEDLEIRKRKRDSMSPEVDLMLSELDNAHTMVNLSFLGSDFSIDDKATTDEHINIAHNRRAASPPLEHDEKEFTQTASDMQQRKRSEEAEKEQRQQSPVPSPSESMPDLDGIVHHDEIHDDESEEAAAARNRKAADALFGDSHHLLGVGHDGFVMGSSPMLRPVAHHGLHVMTTPRKGPTIHLDMDVDVRKESMYDDGGYGELKSAESVDLAELDDLLGGY